MKLKGYGKIRALGAPENEGLLSTDVVLEEKVDGSQFTFGLVDGELVCQSRTRDVSDDDNPKEFGLAVASVRQMTLPPGWIYRAEFLRKPRHNALRYGRIPKGHLALFDVDTPDGRRLNWDNKALIAHQLGIDVVSVLNRVTFPYASNILEEAIKPALQMESFLGGRIEGVVIKPLHGFQRNADGDLLHAKYVSEAFKETTSRGRPGNDQLADLMQWVHSERRFEKAVERMRDAGLLLGNETDIGALYKCVQQDVDEELAYDLKEALWNVFRKTLLKGATNGLAQWYKDRMASA